MKRLIPIMVLICILAEGNSLQAQWTQSSGLSGQNISCFAVSGGELFAGSLGSGIFYSYDNGATWTPLGTQPANENVHALAISGGALFAGTTTGIYKLSNTGWVAVNTGFTDTTVNTLLTQGSDLLAGTDGGGVYLSADEGTSWMTMNGGLGNLYVTALFINNNPLNYSGIEIFAATYDGLYYTNGLPGSWTLIRPLMTNMSSFAAIGQNLFGGTLYSGVSLSTDNGTTWTTMNSGLTNIRVQCLAPSGGNLFAGTSAGVCVLMNNANANEWIPENSGLSNTNISSLFAYNGVLLAGTTNGVWTYPLSIYPRLISVKDVPFDQGGYVDLAWTASSLDTNVYDLSHYSIWRAIPQGAAGAAGNIPVKTVSASSGSNRIRIVTTSAGTFAFQWIGEEMSHRLSMYSYVAPTLSDSMAGTSGMEYFMVSAESNNANVFYDSNIDSGYSVDNLPPGAPAALAANINSGSVSLQWKAAVAPDLWGYLIYRSTSPLLSVLSLTPYATTADTAYLDAKPITTAQSYYVVAAKDIHGNLSPLSNQVSVLLTGIDSKGGLPKTFALMQNYPDPFNPTTLISYQLSAVSNVSLKVYDMLGREVASLFNGRENPGSYSVMFDGSRHASGVYLYRLVALEDNGRFFTATRKLVLMK
jgi:hypothetical protein